MPTKTITGAFKNGYTLSSAYSTLVLDANAQVGGNGVKATTAATVKNFGTIATTGTNVLSTVGVFLGAGGVVANYSQISSAGNGVGAAAGSVATITNQGTIAGKASGVYLDTGSVTNGSGTNTTASILGDGNGILAAHAVTIANYGTIGVTNNASVQTTAIALSGGGTVTNGSESDTTALITSFAGGVQGYGITGIGGATTVTNFGTIRGFGSFGQGVALGGGGVVTNGSENDTGALIVSSQSNGVTFQTTQASVLNYGTIRAPNGVGVGVGFGGGGSRVTNGSETDRVALILGSSSGVAATSAISVNNFAAIQATAGVGVNLLAGGQVNNGSATDTSATITGASKAGIYAGATASVVNFGTVRALKGDGVNLYFGGVLTNGSASVTSALIQSDANGRGVYTYNHAATINNFGTIQTAGVAAAGLYGSGVDLGHGGLVSNGSTSDTTALIASASGHGVAASYSYSTVANFGTILGNGSVTGTAAGVVIGYDGVVINGSAADTAALISTSTGDTFGVLAQGAYATITNYGAITAASKAGVALQAGGAVTNGSLADTVAFIQGADHGVAAHYTAATVANFGTIRSANLAAVYLDAGGLVTNGSELDTKAAIIGGAHGVSTFDSHSTVNNFGTISGASQGGVNLQSGGQVTNGSEADTVASISGATHGVAAFAKATIANYGTIAGVSQAGVFIQAGGSVTNGSALDTTAAIIGQTHGVAAFSGAGTVANFGTIRGATLAGVYLGAGGEVTNGSALNHTALITGDTAGVYATGPATTVTNFGTIAGTVNSIWFNAADDRLIMEAGSRLVGKAIGGGGSLELASGVGTLSGLGTSFQGFGAYEIDAGATWTLAGTNAVNGGALTLDAGARLKVASKTTLNQDINNAGTLEGLAGSTITLAGHAIHGGTLTSAGSVRVTGTSAFDGLTTGPLTSAATVAVGNQASLGMSGSVINSGVIQIAATKGQSASLAIVGPAGVTLSGGGQVTLSSAGTNSILAGSLGAGALVNVDNTISGGGAITIGLTNLAGGVIRQTGAKALTINTGGAAVINQGVIRTSGGGGLTIQNAVVNDGTLMSGGGVFMVAGAVTGSGSAVVNAGTLTFAGAFTENVKFGAGSTGVLSLWNSAGYTGTISGFTTGTMKLDLRDFSFVRGHTTAVFASGQLTLNNGTTSESIKLAGSFAGTTFVASSDGHGGTMIVNQASAPAFVSAMASLGAGEAANSVLSSAAATQSLSPRLATPVGH